MHQAIYKILFMCLLSLASSVRAGIEQVSFSGADGALLKGTLQLPARSQPCPALVLIAGSGPVDRDGNVPPSLKTDLLKQIAEKLAQQGIVTLRYDKRGMYANAAEMPKDKSKLGDFFAWEHFVGDVVGAQKFLRQQPSVDPMRVGLLGHSEGGLLALEAARKLQSDGDAPPVLILLSTPGRSIDRVVADQLKATLEKQHATPAQSDYFLGENARITTVIQQTGKVPADVPAGLAALYPAYLGKFLHSEMELDPCKAAAEFKGPVLVISGSADTQVSPEHDAEALDAALSGRQGDVHKLALIAGASHNLKIVHGTGDGGFAGPVAPAALDELSSWIAEQVSRKN